MVAASNGLLVLAIILSLFSCVMVFRTNTSHKNSSSADDRKASEGYKDALSEYNDLMLRITPIREMTKDELYSILCDCSHKYSQHSPTLSRCNDCSCARHSKLSEIRWYLKDAPIVKPALEELIPEDFDPYNFLEKNQ